MITPQRVNPDQDPNINNHVVVREKATGFIISLFSQKEFHPALHEIYAPVETETKTNALESQPDLMTEDEAKKIRFTELKEKGWNSLNKEERAEYTELKALS